MPNKPKTEDLLSQLAAGARANPRFQAIQEALGGRDIADVFSPSAIGFTKQAAEKVIFNALKSHPRGKALIKELDDLLKVVWKTPKKATAHIKEFKLDPGFQTSGSYHPDALNLFPDVRTIQTPATMASSYAHEAGHGVASPMVGRIYKSGLRKRLGGVEAGIWESPERVGMNLYHSSRHTSSFEGVAEYLGQHLQKQAGLEPVTYFGYGPEQQVVFEQLSKMPSKNPYFNVYRYLQKVLGE